MLPWKSIATSLFAIGCVLLFSLILRIADAQEPDYHEELTEWVFEPCMEVAAAFVVEHISTENRGLGANRKSLAEGMMVSQRKRMKEVVDSLMQTGAGLENWEDRREMYPSMLRICLNGILREAG